MAIKVFSQYGNVRQQAARGNRFEQAVAARSLGRKDEAHGLSRAQIEALSDRMDKFAPQMGGLGQGAVQDVMSDILPKDASLDPFAGKSYRQARQRTAAGTNDINLGNRSNTLISQQRPYQPEFESPDRQQYPVHRILANRYWRLFYKMDPIIGNGIDMYSELPWSDYELTGDGIDGEIKDTLEYMDRETQVRSILPFMVREFLVTGEACPHTFYDDDKGIWTYIAMHNPDQLEVIDAPFIKMDPVVEFMPDSRLQEILTSSHPMLHKVRDSMPNELLSRLMARENIPLSPVNFTFLPRKLHPYDTRGTSIISRMWRILMYEDSIFNASIATARRHAGPLKVAKLGSPQNGWIPGPEQERKLLELLSQAELDVNAWLVYHYGIQFEMVGTTDRIMSIDKHWDLIERVKLIALGISKAFLHGEVTYASAASGLTVFLQRLKAMRQMFENKWLYPKYYGTIAKINKWVKPSEAELSHRVRVRRSSREVDEDKRWIIPRMEWERSLDPSVDAEMINAMQALQGLGVQFSKSTLMAQVNRDFEEEQKQRIKDSELEQRLFEDHPELMQPTGGDPMGGGAMPGGDPGMMPGIPPENFGETLAPVEEPSPEGAGKHGDDSDDTEHKAPDKATIWDKNDKYGTWQRRELRDLFEMFQGYAPEDNPWTEAYKDQDVRYAIGGEDPQEIWDALVMWMADRDFPTRDVKDLEDILKAEGILSRGDELPNVYRGADNSQVIDLIKESDSTSLLSGAP